MTPNEWQQVISVAEPLILLKNGQNYAKSDERVDKKTMIAKNKTLLLFCANKCVADKILKTEIRDTARFAGLHS